MPSPVRTRRGTPLLERFLLYGDGGAGKSRKVLEVIKWFLKMKQSPEFYWLSSDNRLQGFWVPGSGFDECQDLVDEIKVSPADWGTWIDGLDRIKKATASNPSIADWPEDEMSEIPWLVVDLARDAWLAAQNAHVDRVAGKSATDYWIEQEKDARAAKDTSGWAIFQDINYTVINRLYAELANQLINFPGHVVVITAEEPVKKKNGSLDEPAQVAGWFGRAGFKPRGQRDLSYQMSTIIRCEVPKRENGPWQWRRLKELPGRDRVEVGTQGNGGDASDMFLEYFKPVGWSMR